MAIHFSILAWRIPWTVKSAGYSPWGRKESNTSEQLNMHTHCHINVTILYVYNHTILSIL